MVWWETFQTIFYTPFCNFHRTSLETASVVFVNRCNDQRSEQDQPSRILMILDSALMHNSVVVVRKVAVNEPSMCVIFQACYGWSSLNFTHTRDKFITSVRHMHWLCVFHRAWYQVQSADSDKTFGKVTLDLLSCLGRNYSYYTPCMAFRLKGATS